ncbi:Membrane protein involved in the export of O-antigen, teichoic acid lipoteichoic acids [Methanosarcina barkeri str. Wiesmoor]|uniref:Membrane protein involved in the export of O-antigen, teichoic acid lipoteichoic acids n=2 Tax=Methanosarcina barkeri TaxID=2208 RepID=A0A0E3QHQ0_METBA|nr:flippase [Methanosarcina barkeri]AKB50208.1 Membrane protein involved in the export of O-antigen, teichoic acid lipoteichoic acids [Methanosarcina barkeri str. Wiesmoor]
MFFINKLINARQYILSYRSNKTIRDVQWSFLSLVTSSLAHLLLRMVLGKELGPKGLGTYTLVFTIYIFGMQFAAFGFGAALTNSVAKYKNNISKTKDYISSGVIGSIVSGSIMGIILYSSSEFISVNFFHIPEMVTLLKITTVCFPFIAIQKVTLGTLNGFRKMDHFAAINILQNTFVFLVSIFFVFFLNMGITGAVIGFVVPTVMIGVLSLLYIRRSFSLPSRIVLVNILREITWFGFYVVLGNSINMINTQIGSLLIGRFMSETDVGYYATAVIIIQGMTLIPSAINTVATPAIATHHEKKEHSKIKKLVKNTMIKIFLIEIIFLILLTVFGKYIILILFSEEFIPAYTPMLILSIGYLIYAPWMSVGSIFASIGKVNLSFKLNGLCAILNTTLNFLLIPKFGLIGAASSTTFSLIFTFILNLCFIIKYINIK